MEDDGENILPEFENRIPENKALNEITFTELNVFIKLQKLKEDKWAPWAETTNKF